MNGDQIATGDVTISVRGLTKTFRRPQKEPGLLGSLRHLGTRRFQEVRVIDDVSFSVTAGEAVAYIGPNGAGKSTTVKLLAGILAPSAGEVRVCGVDPHRSRVENARRVGVLFGQRTQLWWDLPVRDSLALLRDMHGVDAQTYRRRLARFDEVLELGRLLPLVARKLSLGERMRADLAAALLHGPRIAYLDEPTIGLDIDVKDRVRAFLRTLRDDGTTIVLTTHDLRDVEDLCPRLILLVEGRIMFDGSLEAAKKEFSGPRMFQLGLVAPVTDQHAVAESLRRTLPGIEIDFGVDLWSATVRFDGSRFAPKNVLDAVAGQLAIRDFALVEPSIEELVRRVYATGDNPPRGGG